MVSLQSALLPEPAKPRPPCLSLWSAGGAGASTATSRKRKRDGSDDDDDGQLEDSRGEVVDGIELNFEAAPLPPDWQRCLDIKSGQIHYYNTRTHKRTRKDPRAEPDYRARPAAEEDDEESANCAPDEGLDLELNLNLAPRRVTVNKEKRPNKPAADRRRAAEAVVVAAEDGREMVPAVCVRCHMLVMMCRANPACPNCKFLHSPSRASVPPPAEPEPLMLALRPLCCRD